MSAHYIFTLTIVAIGGACIATQAVMNGRLSAHLGDLVTTAAISFIVAAILLSIIVVARGTVPSASAMAGAPWWGGSEARLARSTSAPRSIRSARLALSP